MRRTGLNHKTTPCYPLPQYHGRHPGTLHRHLPHEELKDLLRRRFARAGLEPPIFFDKIDEIVLLIRRFGFAVFLEGVEIAVQELTRPPVPPVDFAELARQTEEAIAAYQERMRAARSA